jgi:hypothetical protein
LPIAERGLRYSTDRACDLHDVAGDLSEIGKAPGGCLEDVVRGPRLDRLTVEHLKLIGNLGRLLGLVLLKRLDDPSDLAVESRQLSFQAGRRIGLRHQTEARIETLRGRTVDERTFVGLRQRLLGPRSRQSLGDDQGRDVAHYPTEMV